MARILTDNPLEISAGHVCHPGTSAIKSQSKVLINGFSILRCGVDRFPALPCTLIIHPRECSLTGLYPNIKNNGYPVFTDDNFLLCGESMFPGLSKVFV